MAATFCSTAQAIDYAGSGANATITADTTTLTEWIEEAESHINIVAQYDFTTDFSNLSANFKNILRETAAAMTAQKIVMYDFSGYLGAREAETLLDFLENIIVRNLARIKDDNVQEYMGKTGD